jgi:O-antigen/teichoic acid export membrane protein
MLKKRLIKGSLYELVNFILIIVKGVILLPLILSYWSSQKFGIYIAALSFIELCKIFDVGFQMYVRNLINYTYHIDFEKSKSILGSGIIFSFVLGLIEFFLGLFLLLFFRIDLIIFGSILTNTEIFSILFYLFVWALVGSASGIISYLLQTTGQYFVEVRYMIIQLISQILILILSSILDYSVSSALILNALSFLLLTIYFITDVKKKCPKFFPLLQLGNLKEGFSMFKKSLHMSYANSLELLITNLTPLFINYFLNPTALVTFNAVKTLTNSLSQISNLFINPALPELIKLYAQKK